MSLFDQMLRELPFNRKELMLLVLTAPQRYKVHLIQKRNGRGLREIAQPTAEVKLLQRWLVANVIEQLPLHSAAVAYRKGGSILAHARPHAANQYLLKLDFVDFFPSITADDLDRHVSIYGADIAEGDMELLKRVLFRSVQKGVPLKLSIGAPSSPAVSNSIMFPFDEEVQKLSAGLDVVYTRYADDLAFSTNKPRVLDVLHGHIREICNRIVYPYLRLNDAKTVSVSRKHHRELTGIVLTNGGSVSLGRENRRLLRSMIDHFARGRLSIEEVARLRGLIAFGRSVDPTIVDLVERRLLVDQIRELIPGWKPKQEP